MRTVVRVGKANDYYCASEESDHSTAAIQPFPAEPGSARLRIPSLFGFSCGRVGLQFIPVMSGKQVMFRE